ncbi:phytoene/squalene synthase family protein [Geomicrobium sediminis]|uniref:Phytoene synthase n=1 Tax=Geomicrobium sediminis TaxID=1347788 RepID=A0ABS2PFK5_9BACL|nr:phytoene/squalene synthase family protein [Geomicrobium sediminis]MBM7633613.1 phytoene synthase [Geomicrobium sediminis]
MLSKREAYQRCKTQIDKHSKTFSKAFQSLPTANRQAVWAVYAFCRYADDIVDEGANPKEQLLEFEREFQLFLENNQRHVEHKEETSYIWIALEDVFQTFTMRHEPFLDMIQGQQFDLEEQRFATLAHTETYGYYVAGSVGLMLQPILAPKRSYEEMKDGAVALGVAMQITNILRDIGEDYEIDRLYVPQSLLNMHPKAMEAITTKTVNDDFVMVWEQMASRADELYEEALRTIHYYPIYSRFSVKAAAHLYWKILDKVRSNGYNVFHERSYVDQTEKKLILEQIQIEGTENAIS